MRICMLLIIAGGAILSGCSHQPPEVIAEDPVSHTKLLRQIIPGCNGEPPFAGYIHPQSTPTAQPGCIIYMKWTDIIKNLGVPKSHEASLAMGDFFAKTLKVYYCGENVIYEHGGQTIKLLMVGDTCLAVYYSQGKPFSSDALDSIRRETMGSTPWIPDGSNMHQDVGDKYYNFKWTTEAGATMVHSKSSQNGNIVISVTVYSPEFNRAQAKLVK